MVRAVLPVCSVHVGVAQLGSFAMALEPSSQIAYYLAYYAQRLFFALARILVGLSAVYSDHLRS